MKRIVIIMLCIAMLGTYMTGCSSKDNTENPGTETTDNSSMTFEPQPNESESDNENDNVLDYTPNDEHIHGVDYDAAFAAFEPDTIMLTIGNFDVKWTEMYFYLRGNVRSMEPSFDGAIDWEEIYYGDTSVAELVSMYALESAKMYKTLEHGAQVTGAALDASDWEVINDEFEQMAMYYGGTEEFLQLLWEEEGFYNRELVDYMLSIGYLANMVFNNLYGENGENLSDDYVADFTMYDGYLMAKHILVAKSDEDGDDTALQSAQNILRELESYTGNDFEGFFDELMYAYSEDYGGLASYPDGYLFQNGDMVPEFYDACISLGMGEMSGIVETTYGYHILYRLPLNYDVVPISSPMYGDYRTLRTLVASIMFDDELMAWSEELSVEYSDEYKSIELGRVFAYCEH